MSDEGNENGKPAAALPALRSVHVLTGYRGGPVGVGSSIRHSRSFRVASNPRARIDGEIRYRHISYFSWLAKTSDLRKVAAPLPVGKNPCGLFTRRTPDILASWDHGL